MNRFHKRILRPESVFLLLLAGLALTLPACQSDGNIRIFGYGTDSQFDKRYHTIRVPIFKNITLYRGLEFDLTKAVVNEIERRTHYKVVECDADLELTGKITLLQKNVILGSPVNEVRNAELTMTVEVVLKDLRTGQILSKAPRRPGVVVPEDVPLLRDNPNLPGSNLAIPATPTAPGAVDQDATLAGPPGVAPALPVYPGQTFGPDEPVDPNKKPVGLVIKETGNYIPEVGQSTTTAEQSIITRMSRQIVNMMEVGW